MNWSKLVRSGLGLFWIYTRLTKKKSDDSIADKANEVAESIWEDGRK